MEFDEKKKLLSLIFNDLFYEEESDYYQYSDHQIFDDAEPTEELWLCGLLLFVLIVISVFVVWRRRLALWRREHLPYNGWTLYFDSRNYLHPRMKVPVAFFGELMDPAIIAFKHKRGDMLTSTEIKKLLLDPTIKRFVQQNSPENLMYGICYVAYNSVLPLGGSVASLYTPVEFVILDNRPALDVLSEKYYVQILMRKLKSKYTLKSTPMRTCFQQVDGCLARFFLYYPNNGSNKNNLVIERRYPDATVRFPDIDYILNDFYCLPYTRKIAQNFLRQHSEKYAKMFIVGDNGFGKTTFARLILEHTNTPCKFVSGFEISDFAMFNDLYKDAWKSVWVIDEFDKFLVKMKKTSCNISKQKERLESGACVTIGPTTNKDKNNLSYCEQHDYELEVKSYEFMAKFLDKLYFDNMSIILIGNEVRNCKFLVEEMKGRDFAKGFFRAGRFEPVNFTLDSSHYPDICDFYMPTLTKSQKSTLVQIFTSNKVSTSYICEVAQQLGYKTCFKIPHMCAADFDYKPTPKDFEQVLKRVATMEDYMEENY